MGSVTFSPNDKIMKIENSLSGLIRNCMDE